MRIAVIADVHFQGGPLLPVIARAWSDAWDACVARNVQRIIVAGDLHEDAALALGRDGTAGDIQAAILAPIRRHAIALTVVAGNHDLSGPGHLSALEYLRHVEGVAVEETPHVVDAYDPRNGQAASIAYLPWASNAYLLADPALRALPREEFLERAAALRRQVLCGFAAEWAGRPGYHILIGHAEVGGAVNRYRELPPGSTHVFSAHDLAATGAAAICLGHYHKRQAVDGVDLYVGALVQLNHGEEGNPTGFCVLDTASGTREWVDIDCPRFYTVTAQQYAALTYRSGVDRVKVRDVEPPRDGLLPADLPEGVRFERLPSPREVRLRADGISVDSSTEDLLRAWYPLRTRDVPLDDALQRMHGLLEEHPLRGGDAAGTGGVDAVREIHLRNIGPHRDTHVVIPETQDGLLALVGHNGAGKTFVLEALPAALFGEFPYYPGPLYDNVPEGFTGDALVDVVFESSGRTYRGTRRLHLTARGKNQECYLYEVADRAEIPLAGPKQADYEAAVRRLVGDQETWFATVFQGQEDTGSLIDADPADRLAFARRWVGADRFDALQQAARGMGMSIRGTIEERERRATDLATAKERIPGVEQQISEKAAEAATVEGHIAEMRTHRALAEEDVARLRADQLAREELQRQVVAAEQAEQRVAADLRAAQEQMRRDQVELDRESELQSRVTTLQQLRQELMEAQQEQAAIAAVSAQRAAKDAEIHALQTEIEADHQRAVAEVSSKREALRARYRELEGQIATAVAEQRAEVEQRRATLRLRIQEATAELEREIARQRAEVEQERAECQRKLDLAMAAIAGEQGKLEAELDGWRREEAELERQKQRFDAAGCRANPLPCRFIDDASGAPTALEGLRERITARQSALECGMFAQKAREEAARLQRDLTVTLPAEPRYAWPEKDADIHDLRRQLEAIHDVDPLTVAAELRSEQAAVIQRGKTLQDPTREDVCGEKLARLVVLHLEQESILIPIDASRDVSVIQRDIAALATAEQDLGRLGAVRENLERLRATVSTLHTDAFARAAETQAARERLAAVASVDEALAAVRARCASLDQRIADQQNVLALIAREAGALEAALSAAREQVREAERLAAALEAARLDARAYAVLAEFFGPTGGSQLLVDVAVQQLNGILADLVADMDEPVQITCGTQRALKGGGSREGLWIDVTDGAGTRDIRRHSFGEQGWMRKVFRQALGLFSVQRSGGHHRIYACDEPTLGLDARNVPRLLSVIYRLAQRFRQVWIVSHDAVLLSGIPSQFRLERVNGATRVESTFSQAPCELEEVAA